MAVKKIPDRVPVLVDEDMHGQLRQLAFDTRDSMAEHIRRAVDLYLKKTSGESVGEPVNPKRILVSFDEHAYENLRKLSFDTNISMSEHVRRAVIMYFQSLV